MILPLKVPIFKFESGESLGLHTVPLESIVQVKRKLYYYDNDNGITQTSTINQAVSNKNLLDIMPATTVPVDPETPVKTPLQAPTLSILPTMINVGESVTIKLADVDENTQSLVWNISGVSVVNPEGVLVGSETVKISELNLTATSYGTLRVSCYAKPAKSATQYSDSASSNSVTATVSKVVQPGTGKPEDDYNTYIDASVDMDGSEGVVINPVKTGGLHVYFNALPHKSPGSPFTCYIALGDASVSSNIFKVSCVEEYMNQQLLVKRVKDEKYFTGVICEADNSSKTPCIFSELSV